MSRTIKVRAFTLIEVLVSVAITAFMAGFIITIVGNVSGFWSRSSGRMSAEAQGRYILDQLALDLQSALYHDDGNTWLAATVLSNTSNTGSWNTQNTTPTGLKPANAAGSLQFIATGNLSDNSDRGPRFGQAGTWLRFFTMKRGSNLTTNATTTGNTASAPVAVAYQIVRRATTTTSPNNEDRRYLLHRAEVRPSATGTAVNGTLQAGFNIVATAYQPGSGSGVNRADPGEIRYANLDSVIAENVIDFGVRLHTYVLNEDGKRVLVQIFPTTNATSGNALSYAAKFPPGLSKSTEDGSTDYTECFPDVVDVMVRVLTDEGAKLLRGYEGAPQKISLPQGRTAQQFWWDLALANSQVFTRRIVINSKPL